MIKFIKHNWLPLLITGLSLSTYFIHTNGISMAVAPLVLGALAQVGSSILGGIFSSGASDQAKQAAAQAYQQYEALGYPPDQTGPLVLEHLKQQGLLEPQLEQAITLGTSKAAQIQEDPSLRGAQMSALDMLRQRAGQGYTAQERSALNQIRSQVAQDTQGKLGQIQQNMQARGISGGGADLAAQLQAAQSGADREAQAGDQVSADAAKNALQAMSLFGDTSGKIRGQDFDVANAKAQAADMISKFNAEQSIGRQTRNVGTANAAQAANLSEQQRTADYNAALDNAEKNRQLAAGQQLWANKMQLAGTKAGALLGQAQQGRADAAQTGQNWQNIGSGLGSIGKDLWSADNAQQQLDIQKKKAEQPINIYQAPQK